MQSIDLQNPRTLRSTFKSNFLFLGWFYAFDKLLSLSWERKGKTNKQTKMSKLSKNNINRYKNINK